MQIRIAAAGHDLDLQVIVVQFDHLGRVTRRRQAFRHDQRDGFPDKAQLALGQQRIARIGPLAPVPRGHQRRRQTLGQPGGLQIVDPRDQVHTLGRPRLLKVQRGDRRMRHGRA